MRKTSYAVAFVLVAALLVVNISAAVRTDWLVVHGLGHLKRHTVVRFGLARRCERDVVEIPFPTGDAPTIFFSEYTCRSFPMSVRDRCEHGNRHFCVAWATASYIDEVGIGFNVLALLAIAFGVTTHSRRRRIWKAVACLVGLASLFPMISFAIVSDLFRTAKFWEFSRAQLSWAYYMNTIHWVLGFVVTGAIVVNGIAANKGHQWAAGNRAYRPIDG